MDKKIAFIHGRLGPHIMHGRLAKSVNAEFHMVDKYKVWNDGIYNRLYIIYAWIYNAIAFKNPEKYDIYLVSGPHFSPIIMKLFRLNKKQKVFAHLGDETMYFLYDKWYSSLMQKVLVSLLNNYDGLLCEGQMAADLAILNGINRPKLYTTYLGVPKERKDVLLKISPDLNNKNLVFLSTGPKGWRTYYKGLDLMINAYQVAFQNDPELSFTIIGEWDSDLQKLLTNDCTEKCKKSIHFVGHTDKIDEFLSKGSIYYHTARGDAFPTVVLEAMSAGLIPIVSVWTGSKEVVKKVDDNLIVELDVNQIANKILEIINLPHERKIELSQKCKLISQEYTEEFALNHYQNTFNQIVKDFNL